jgi:hypothetical protein
MNAGRIERRTDQRTAITARDCDWIRVLLERICGSHWESARLFEAFKSHSRLTLRAIVRLGDCLMNKLCGVCPISAAHVTPYIAAWPWTRLRRFANSRASIAAARLRNHLAT